jgi:hypothetical protein
METAGIVTWVVFGIALWLAAGAAFLLGWLAFNQAIERAGASPEHALPGGVAESPEPDGEPLPSGAGPRPAASKSVFA